MSKEKSFKVVFVGESGVGKTSIINTFCNGRFDPFSTSTVSASCLKKDVITNGVKVPLTIWDTAGQERFQSLIPMYTRSSNACIIVIDLSHPIALDQLIMYYDYLLEQLDYNCVVSIFGNKCDLINQTFDMKELKEWVKNKDILLYIVSAKENIGIEAAFNEIALEINNRFQNAETNPNLLNSQNSKTHKGCSC